jgi:hypothetical protein
MFYMALLQGLGLVSKVVHAPFKKNKYALSLVDWWTLALLMPVVALVTFGWP